MTTSGDPPSEDECTVHDHPVPPSELWRYSIDRDPHSEQDIEDYINGQASDEVVQHVERIKREIVIGEIYDIWDVTTDKNRWWVITNLTNLYSQRYFPSLDYTLSFHIGLMARLRSRRENINPADPTPFDEVIRRGDQAEERYDSSVEVEDFQTVGMLLRESLLALIAALRRQVSFKDELDSPQNSNFIAWSELLVNELCRGASNKELRQHLKSIGKDAWQLANWLTHTTSASKTSASIVKGTCQTVIGHYIQMLDLQQSTQAGSCPICQSRDLRSHFDRNIGTEGDYYASCGVCDWSNHPGSAPNAGP